MNIVSASAFAGRVSAGRDFVRPRLLPLALGMCLQVIAYAQVGLPRVAVTLPAAPSGLFETLGASSSCMVQGSPVVVSAGEFDPGQTVPIKLPAALSTAIAPLPATSEIWLILHLRGAQLTGHETQSELDSRVDGLLGQLPLDAPSLKGLIVRLDDPGAHTNLTAYALLRLSTGAHVRKTNLRLAVAFATGMTAQNHDLIKRVAPYTDLLGLSDGPDWRSEAAWVAGEALNKPLLLQADSKDRLAESLLSAVIGAAGHQVEFLWTEPGTPEQASQSCLLSRSLAKLIPAGELPMEPSAVQVSLTGAGVGKKALWLSNGQSSDIYALIASEATPSHPLDLRLSWPKGKNYQTHWFNPLSGESLSTAPSLTVTAPYVLATLERKDDLSTQVYSQVEVKGGVSLSVEEIVARWQQYRASQDSKLENYQASNFVSLHFETVSIGSGFDISMRMKQFYRRGAPVEFAQTDLYVNGVHFGKNRQFPLPQLEPEKVVTQPLELKLNERYDYFLEGTERLDGVLCFVVGVKPKVSSEALYSGKIWIDGESFREVRQSLSETSARTSVVASVETEDFALVDDGKGGRFNLPKSLVAQQTLNVAGRDFHLQRTVQFGDYLINAATFGAAVQAEDSSTDAMYRDTDQGLRELKREGSERVLVPQTTKRIRSLVMGAMYEGTFDFPIPFAGISYADFDFRHTGAQLSILFAGPFAVVNLSRQQNPHTRLSMDVAVSGLPADNRDYSDPLGYLSSEVWQWSESAGGRLTWQPSPHISITPYTYFEYDIYRGTSSTDKAYKIPSAGPVLLPGAQIRLTDRGYIFTAEGLRGQRFGWTSFGYPASAQRLEGAYTLYNADLSKDYYFTKFTKGGVDFSYEGGVQQDRFSRYQTSFLSPHGVHGVVGNPVSFDALAVASAHYGFNVMDLFKVEGQYSYAQARNLQMSSHFRNLQGAELNFNTAGPWGTLMQGSVSYAAHDALGPLNTRWGFQVMLFKPLK